MPPTKTYSFLPILILLFSFFYSEKTYAQQPTGIASQNAVGSVQPWDARAMDSIYSLNEMRGRTTRNSINTKQYNSAARPSVYTGRKVSAKTIYNRTTPTSNVSQRPNAVCYTVSGRNFLEQDSLMLYSGDPTFALDGNLLVSGEFADYAYSPLHLGGFCMKTDIEGNVIWAKLYDSTAEVSWDHINYFKPLQLRDGSILLAGRTTNKISGNDDFILTKVNSVGDIIWSKTYECRFWQGFNGSGDFFSLRDLEEDPTTGEIYFVGNLWGGLSTITKVHPSDGHVIWSNGYDTWGGGYSFGIVINTGNLFLFQLESGSGNQSSIVSTAINKASGDTLFSKQFTQTGGFSDPRLYNTFEVVKQNNGHFLLSGPTTRYFEFPTHTGTVDLYHAGIIELDENLDFVRAYGVKNRVPSNGVNTRISLFPDGSGVFTTLNVIRSFTAFGHIAIFNKDQIYHQRRRIHANEGLPYEPPTLQLSNGGFINIKLMGDSTTIATDGSHLDYYRMHSSDTASICIGLKDSSASFYYFDFAPAGRLISTIHRDVFKLSRVKTFNTWDFAVHPAPPCQVISNCDSLIVNTSATVVCPGTSITVTIRKNKGCGSLALLNYDTSFVSQATKINDTTYQFHFDQPGKGYIVGSLMGCELKKDSAYIEVLPVLNTVNIGPDTIICPGNKVFLNAKSGFASYVWQDGTVDSTYTVTTPGKYYVTAVNSCGTIYSDTVVVADHPPIPLSIGPDRFKCNNDTIRITAPTGFINYNWSSNYNISAVTGQQVIVNPLVDTSYFLAAELTPGCFAYDTVRIIVKSSPTINIGPDTSVCRNDTLTLNAGTGFANYLWSTGSTQQQLKIFQPGNYFIKATTTDGCSSYDTLHLVSLYNLPQPNLGADSVICLGHPRLLGTAGNYANYLWNTGDISRTISVNTPGKYWLTVTDGNGCVASDTTFIPSVEKGPSNFLGSDTTICSYGEMVLKPSTTFDRRWWSTGSTSSSITVTQSGNYWLEVIDRNNCRGIDTVIVTLKDCMEGLFVPSAFTPNNDGRNDLFKPMLFGNIKSFRFQVFNRWGEIVFQTSVPGTGWDGKFKGTIQDTNLFIWTCTYQLMGGAVENKKGSVMIIR